MYDGLSCHFYVVGPADMPCAETSCLKIQNKLPSRRKITTGTKATADTTKCDEYIMLPRQMLFSFLYK